MMMILPPKLVLMIFDLSNSKTDTTTRPQHLDPAVRAKDLLWHPDDQGFQQPGLVRVAGRNGVPLGDGRSQGMRSTKSSWRLSRLGEEERKGSRPSSLLKESGRIGDSPTSGRGLLVCNIAIQLDPDATCLLLTIPNSCDKPFVLIRGAQDSQLSQNTVIAAWETRGRKEPTSPRGRVDS